MGNTGLEPVISSVSCALDARRNARKPPDFVEILPLPVRFATRCTFREFSREFSLVTGVDSVNTEMACVRELGQSYLRLRSAADLASSGRGRRAWRSFQEALLRATFAWRRVRCLASAMMSVAVAAVRRHPLPTELTLEMIAICANGLFDHRTFFARMPPMPPP